MSASKRPILDPDDDAPDLSAPEWRAKAEAAMAARRAGRPSLAEHQRKVVTTIRLDPDVIAHFRSAGAGWQTRVNEALREWIGSRTGAS